MIERAIVSRLKATTAVTVLVGQRIYPGIAPQNAALPRITYTRISTTRNQSFRLGSTFSNARIQIDGWADTYSKSKQLADAVRNALDGYYGTVGADTIQGCILISEGDLPEPIGGGDERLVHRVSMDFSVWFAETAPVFS